MTTKKELEELSQALKDYVLIANDSVNIEKKRTGIQTIISELEKNCPFVKDYEQCQDIRIIKYLEEIDSGSSALYEIKDLLKSDYPVIKVYESLDEQTKKEYYDKLVAYYKPDRLIFSVGNNPDRIFMTNGSYRLFYKYQNSEVYQVARKMRGDLEERGEEDFDLNFRIYLLYCAAINEITEVIETGDRINSLIEKWEDVSEDTSCADDSKLLPEFIRIFHSARAEQINTVPEETKEKIRELLSERLDMFVRKDNESNGNSFKELYRILSTWENLAVSAASKAEEIVPVIVCYDCKAHGETPSSCIKDYVSTYSKELKDDYLYHLAFFPKGKELGLVRYNFWGEKYEDEFKKYKGMLGLTDESRALFKQDYNNKRLVKEVKTILSEPEGECFDKGEVELTYVISLIKERIRDYCQDLFFQYNELIDKTNLTQEGKKNALLGWIYFTKLLVGGIPIPESVSASILDGRPSKGKNTITLAKIGSDEIFDQMNNSFLGDLSSVNPFPQTQSDGSFQPLNNTKLKFNRLYEYLARKDIRLISVSEDNFKHAVSYGDFKQIMQDAVLLKSRVKVKILIQYLRKYYPSAWYDAVSKSCGIPKDTLKKINYERDNLKDFKRTIEGIPLIDS